MSVSMVSHSQYLCPDYLSPLPTSMENGKSPLALLAQTCNSIGLPDPPSKTKTILPASDKEISPSFGKKESSESKSVSKSESASNFDKTPKKDSSSSKTERANSAGGAADENGNNGSKENGLSEPAKSDSRPTSAPTETRTSVPGGGGTSTTQAVPPTVPSVPSTSRGIPALPPGCPTFGFPFGLPSSYPHAALSMPIPSATYPGLPGLGMPRICMDPNCKSCPPPLPGRTCPLGCTQCSSHPASSSVADLTAMSWLANSYSSFLHGLPAPGANLPSVFPGLGSSNGINPALPGTFPSLSGSTGSGQFICNWVTDRTLGKVCLKCFTSGDELLQHMRTHTTQEAAAKQEANNPLLSLGSPPLGSTAPGHVSGRMSPRTASYWSALRYHPYSKLSPPGGFGSPSLANPHLLFPPSLNPAGYSAALSSLYAGQRLPGSLPHP